MYGLSKLVNSCFRTGLSRFLMILAIFLILFFASGELNLSLLIFLVIVSLILSLNFKRVSNNFVLNRMTGTLNMNIKDLGEYHRFSYLKEKDKIADKLAEEFIEGIINASKYKKKLKMNTHSWMIREVINSKEVQDRFDIKIIVDPLKDKKIITEVLILFRREEFENNIEYAYSIAGKKRDSCKLILRQLSVDELIERQGVK